MADLSIADLEKIFKARKILYTKKSIYLSNVAASYKNLDVSNAKTCLILQKLFDQWNIEELVKAERIIANGKELKFDNYDCPVWPDDMVLVRNYVELCCSMQAKSAKLQSMAADLLLRSYESLNFQSHDVQMELRSLFAVSPVMLPDMEQKLFFLRERIFEESLIYADGEPRRLGDDVHFRSGPYALCNSFRGLNFCLVDPNYFTAPAHMTFNEYRQSLLSFAEEDETQTLSSTDSTRASILDENIKKLIGSLSLLNLMNYKHEQMMNLVEADAAKLNSTKGLHTRNVDLPALPSEPLAQPARNPVEPPLFDEDLSHNILNWRITSVTPSPSPSLSQIESSSSRSEYHNYAIHIDLATVDDWKEYYTKFVNQTVVSRRQLRETVAAARQLHPCLLAIYQKAQEVRHREFLMNINLDRLTTTQVFAFLFMTQLAGNTHADAIIYELLDEIMDK